MNTRSAIAPELSPGGLLARYRPPVDAYDELLDERGNVRAHWRDLIDGLQALGPAACRVARENAQRLLRDNAVTYLPQGQTESASSRPWQLDLLPFMLAPAEHERLQAGLAQRTRLLNAIIADCLGPQKLLRERHIPPGVIYGCGGFLPACHGINAPQDRYLQLVAYDLARGPDGRWWVVRDRVASPSGLGYTLENRLITSQCLNSVFELARVERVAGFFRAINASLENTVNNDDPLSLILASQTRSADYFEHAFLGRYLGHDVVAGADLTVRDERLFLKTIHGLRPVDLLMRRIDSQNADPLELRVDAIDGVPGLLTAIRAGHVTMINWPGAEIAESPGLAPFLPALCRQLLGEELAIPSVASWWCGQPTERDHVLDNLHQLIVRRIDSGSVRPGSRPNHFVGAMLSEGDRARLRESIRLAPHEFVGQEPMTVSVAPIWGSNGEILAASTSLRVFLTDTGQGYRKMPGGLARADAPGSQAREQMRLPNDLNKDVWVGTEVVGDRTTVESLINRDQPLQRSDRNLASRTADNLFWLGSYLERAEGATRLFRSLLQQLSGETMMGQQVATLDHLAAVLVDQGHLSQRRARRLLAQGRRSFLREMSGILFDPDGADNLIQVLGNIARLAETVRERLSPDMWRLLERLIQLPAQFNSQVARDLVPATAMLNAMIDSMAAINGLVALNMTRANGWRFLDSGRRLERVRQSAQLFRELTLRARPDEHGTLNLLLELSDCAITYRTRYRAAAQFALVADIVLADDTHPRSMISQVVALRELLKAMPEVDAEGLPGPAVKALIRMESSLRLLDPWALDARRSRTGTRTAMSRFMTRFENDADLITDRLTVCYFSHATQTRLTGIGA